LDRSDFTLQLGAHFLGDKVRVGPIANDLRPDEDDQLSSLNVVVLRREQIADAWKVVEPRNARTGQVLSFADQAGEKHSLPTRDRNRTTQFARRNRGVDGCG